MPLLIAFAFLGGIVTILSPCILPVLPIVLSGSVGGGKRRPLGVVTGFIASFTFFTLFLTAIVRATGVSPDILRTLAVAVLAVFGATLLFPRIQGKIEGLFSRFASLAPKGERSSGFSGGFLVGLSLGLIWTPCVGPILASVITLALTGSVTGGAFIITLAYALGTAIPMLAIMYGGRSLLARFPKLVANTGKIQKVFGVLMIVTAIGIFFNLDRQFQAYILEKFPRYGTGLTSLEDNEAIREELDKLDGGSGEFDEDDIGKPTSEMQPAGPPAPAIIPGGEWFNSEPLTLKELRGKVVLLDFMTYSCINCIRTFPALNAWHEQYADDGLVIIGIHTPEFEFEKDPENVRDALADFNIAFPVVQDNNYATWRAYGNRYWPRKYLINPDGEIVYDHIGEGAYEKTENKIRELLAARGEGMADDDMAQFTTDTPNAASPEIYFGAQRNERLANGTPGATGEQTFATPNDVAFNQLYLVGTWNITDEYAEAVSDDAKIIFRYSAQNMFMVAGAEGTGDVTVTQDGKQVETIPIDKETLYPIIRNSERESHTVELEVSPGVQVFTFTFG